SPGVAPTEQPDRPTWEAGRLAGDAESLSGTLEGVGTVAGLVSLALHVGRVGPLVRLARQVVGQPIGRLSGRRPVTTGHGGIRQGVGDRAVGLAVPFEAPGPDFAFR